MDVCNTRRARFGSSGVVFKKNNNPSYSTILRRNPSCRESKQSGPDVFVAGDAGVAKETVSKLEALALLSITLQFKHNLSFSTTWKLVRTT